MQQGGVAPITAIVPLHDVEAFVGDFLRSLSAQRPGAYSLDLVFIDDASPDAAADLVEEWIATAPFTATLHRQEHGGVSAARNRGLALARGDWVTFPDPDDLLDPGYFAAIADFVLGVDDDVDVVSANLFRVFDPDPAFQDVHALRFRFVGGSRVVVLDDEPDIFQVNVATALFRRSRLVETGVQFPSGLHASEDALFVSRFLLSRPRARIGLVAEAHYGYRKRATRDSAVDSYQQDPRSYIDRFRDGYLPVLQEAAASGGVPPWLQSILLYESQWLFPRQLDPATYAETLDDDDRREAREALSACLAFVDDDRVLRYDATALPLESRLAVLALSGRRVWNWVGYYADPVRAGARSLTLRGYTTEPGERVLAMSAGRLRRVRASRLRLLDYFGQQRLYERALRVPRGVDAVQDGDLMREVISPRPGETAAQSAERHRRAVIGQGVQAVPSQAGAVRVWKFHPLRGVDSLPHGVRENSRVLAARARHDLRVVRASLARALPNSRAGWLVVADPADPEDLAGALVSAAHAAGMSATLLVRGAAAAGGPHRVRAGSVRAELASMRARFAVVTGLASAARISRATGYRILVLRGAVTVLDRVAVDALDLDLVVVDDTEAAERLRAESSYFGDQILQVAPGDTGADLIEAITGALAGRSSGPRRR